MEDTKSFTTPITKKLVVTKGWISGRDEQAIQAAIQDKLNISMDMQNAAGSSATATGAMLTAGQDKALEIMLLQVDGQTTGLVDLVLDLPAQDTRFIREKINEVTNGMSEEKKADLPAKPSEPGGVVANP